MNLDINAAHEEFRRYLKKENHRITPERFEVLDYALEYDGHFGADELYLKMKNNNSNISRATVYNTLELLAACDLLAKRNFGENKTRYEAKYGKKSHDHLICTNCGAIKEFSEPIIEKIVKEISEKLGFEPSGHSFYIFGKCNNSNCKLRKDDKNDT
ncbi:MAG: transcriptional repressor [Melioribacter sp.]|uniref:Fur family transcriptional regulator n=1 Tax=Rosettibacter primus TaxID=3111523 RepID=UPI00247CAA55|nr:transcriptional repressor [Melioribacter sp.]